MKYSETFKLQTSSHSQLITITSQISNIVRDNRWMNGLVSAFVQHTTCGITINENADPDVVSDLLNRLDKIAPWDVKEDRHYEGNSAAHLKSSILGSSVVVPVIEGDMQLGQWQGIFFGEFDGPRLRRILVTFSPS